MLHGETMKTIAFLFGGNLVSWSSKKQSIIPLSSSESEYVAATHAAQKALWFQQLLEKLGMRQKTVNIYEDNQGCIALTKNPQENKRTRHIQIKYHFIRNQVKAQITLTKTPASRKKKARRGGRTHNLKIKSLTLYQLS